MFCSLTHFSHVRENCYPCASRLARGFTTVELLVVLSLISLLAVLLFPIFLTARGKARESVCLSNLKQIGHAFSMYAQDSDGRYPYAVDPVDRMAPEGWSAYPEFHSAIPAVGMIQDVLQPYTKATAVFHCPADSGFMFDDFNGIVMNALPTSFGKFGTSYYYRTQIAARKASEFTFQKPTEINVLWDGAGKWHGTLVPLAQRYNVLFADGHTKNMRRGPLSEAWSAPL